MAGPRIDWRRWLLALLLVIGLAALLGSISVDDGCDCAAETPTPDSLFGPPARGSSAGVADDARP